MKKDLYCQCRLRKGKVETVAWIPSKYAIGGQCVKLKDSDGWSVVSAGQVMEGSEVNNRSQDYKHTREVSDI